MQVQGQAGILVVDDDTNLLNVLSDALLQAGFISYSATEKTEALLLAGRVQLDAVLLDVRLAGEDGISLCRDLRRTLNHNTPIIFMSARDDSGTVADGISAGADDYVIKPVRVPAVLERLNRLMSLKTTGQSLQARRSRILDGMTRKKNVVN